jgi:hypothetical protein
MRDAMRFTAGSDAAEEDADFDPDSSGFFPDCGPEAGEDGRFSLRQARAETAIRKKRKAARIRKTRRCEKTSFMIFISLYRIF